MLVLPAGTGHRRASARDGFTVVGAYPAGQEDYDLLRGDDPDVVAAARERIAALRRRRTRPGRRRGRRRLGLTPSAMMSRLDPDPGGAALMATQELSVCLAGATGWTGRALVRGILDAPDLGSPPR